MTTPDFIIALFYAVDEEMREVPKHPEAKLYPSEVVTLALLFAIKGGGPRAFYRWLTRAYLPLFPPPPAAPAGPAARPQPPVLAVPCGAGWPPGARGASGTPWWGARQGGRREGAGRRQARAPAGAEWHGGGGRGRWKRPFDFPILKAAAIGR